MNRPQNGTPPRPSEYERLREHSAATAGELRQFIDGLRGRSPQEVLGEIGKSGLVQGVFVSALAQFVLLAVFTVGPYAWAKTAGTKAPEPAASQPAESEAPATTAGANNVPAPPPPPPGAGGAPQNVLDALGESEVKTGEPPKDPLDNLLGD